MDAAERAPISHHAVGKPRAKKGDAGGKGEDGQAAAPPAPKRYQDVFGEWVVAQAETDPRAFVITPAMREGSGLVAYAERFPQRYRDVAIAEQHAVTLAAGMACEQGVKPIVAIYSTFLQRGYDQVVHDMALQGLDVTLAVDRAGLIGEDGPTHAGHYDLALLRCLPGMVVAAPSDEAETLAALQLCYEHEGPAAVRYPRGEVCAPIVAQAQPWQLGRARVLRESGKPGQAPALLAFGYTAAAALQAAEGLDAAVVDMRFVKPLDQELLARLAGEHPLLVTLEDHALAAGAGSAVNECLVRLPQRPAVLNLGVPRPEHPAGQPGAAAARLRPGRRGHRRVGAGGAGRAGPGAGQEGQAGRGAEAPGRLGDVVPQPVALDLQVRLGQRRNLDQQRHPLQHLDAAGLQLRHFVGVVGQKAHRRDAQRVEDGHGHAVIALIGRVPAPVVGLHRVQLLLVLQGVGLNLGAQPYAAPLLAKIHQHPALLGNLLHGGVQLAGAVAALAAQHLAGQAFGVHPHQAAGRVGLAEAERDMLLLVIDADPARAELGGQAAFGSEG